MFLTEVEDWSWLDIEDYLLIGSLQWVSNQEEGSWLTKIDVFMELTLESIRDYLRVGLG